MPAIRFVVDPREAGKTLAAVLRARFGLSWSQAKRLVERRHVRVGGQIETDVARRLKTGRSVELESGLVELPLEPKLPAQPPSDSAAARRTVGPSRRQEQRSKGGRSSPLGLPRPTREAQPRAETATNTTDRSAARSTPPTPAGGSRSRPRGSASSGCEPEIVYVDDAVVVVNKPAGLTTSRSREEAAEFGPRGAKFLPPTLADLLPALIGTPGTRVIPVHRIDRDTSGLVVFARTPAAAAALTQQFRRHSVDRRYLALTRGVPVPGRIESVLVRDRGDGRRGSGVGPIRPADGRRAVTHVRLRETFAGFALVECRLETGRTHQVRIHLGEAGCPLCGERVYDRPLHGRPIPDPSGASRPMLHAQLLRFTHPETGERLGWEVPPPADFAELLRRLRASS